MKKLLILAVLVALGVGGMYVGRRNQMVVKNEAVKSEWAQVDVVLQRRADFTDFADYTGHAGCTGFRSACPGWCRAAGSAVIAARQCRYSGLHAGGDLRHGQSDDSRGA